MALRARSERLLRNPLGAPLIVALLLLAVLTLPERRAVAAGSDPAEVMRKIVQDLDLQDMPAPEPPQPTSQIRWRIPADVARAILIGALIVGTGFALYAVRDTLPRWPYAKPRKGGTPRASPTESAQVLRMEASAEDADTLAGEGRFAEAMHVLLLRSLVELRDRIPTLVSDALTSREILQRAPLPGDGSVALRDLIDRVEVVHFGRREASSDDYRACRTSYGHLLDAMRPELVA